VITVATLLWDANDDSLPFSRHYSEADVEKLYRGFQRNLTVPWRMVCFTEKPRKFSEDIWQERLSAGEPGYGACIEPYKLDEPMILVGLDTVIVGNCDELARYCLEATTLAVPRDPFWPEKVCNGVALVPKGHAWVWREFPGGNDMEWIRSLPVAVIDNLFPRQVVSYKGHVKHYGIEPETRIVYFHGHEKPHELSHIDWVSEHWL
jgi:hypothetical protein